MACEENATSLKRRRAVIQGSCTRVRTFINSIETVTPTVAAQLEERKVKLDACWSEYDAVQSKLELHDEGEANHRDIFEELFFSGSAQIRELLAPASFPRNVASPSPFTSNASDNSESLTHVRLPKINLPSFTGKYDEWYPFFDTFNALIHSNTSITSIQKLQYLKASLSSDASNIISALEISDLNYAVAWNLLKERYDNKRVIVQNHIKAILELLLMAKENVVELRQIADGATRHIHALQALKRPTSHWDDILVHLLSSKLDALSSREWQSSLSSSEIPTMKQFIDFVTHRYQILEAINKPNVATSKNDNICSQQTPRRHSSCVATVKPKCVYCNGGHYVYFCKDFQALPVSRRFSEINKRKICHNCLKSTAYTHSRCTSGVCKICGAKHNTLLHENVASASHDSNASPRVESNPTNSPIALVAYDTSASNCERVILSTAMVYALDRNGSNKPCRILLDCGSQANFVSKQFLDALGLSPSSSNVIISGISKTATKSSQSVSIKLRSRVNSFHATVECIVLDCITNNVPEVTINRSKFDIPQNIKLADPRFHVPSEIDILVGADLFWKLICIGQIKASTKHPTLQKTRFGWILAGSTSSPPVLQQGVQAFHTRVTNADLQEQLAWFWQVEEGSKVSSNFTYEESICEQHFQENVSQTHQGRYIVKLLTREHLLHTLGNSRETALKHFHGLEKRFNRDSVLKGQYSDFLNEYLILGHMKLVDERSDDQSTSYYLPHHCVFKATQQGPKIRVVFDASSKSSTGISLNDVLLVGPTIQQDLMSIMLRFRTFKFVLLADIIKMYRQILVDPSQNRLQRILWRGDSSSEIQTFELTTVTYGTASASYLATRCLKHLADQHADDYPLGSAQVKRDFYVDDLLTGADSIEDAKLVRKEIIDLLRLGAFELSKWSSNCPELLKDIEQYNNDVVTINDPLNSSILGVHWDRSRDTFYFSYSINEGRNNVSKRSILSEISRLFDPLGLLGPAIVLAKLIMQELWQAGVQWDESAPQDVHSRWTKLKFQLRNIHQITIPRGVKFSTERRLVQIHGFCDASQRAYGACVYIRSKVGVNEYRSELLCSRSRVAPLKSVSLPRLELLAASLLASLIDKVNSSVDVSDMRTFLWSDSTIVLNWISSQSRKWSVFVANRVGLIQRLTKIENWRHVASVNNPADILSRGLEPQELANSSL